MGKFKKILIVFSTKNNIDDDILKISENIISSYTEEIKLNDDNEEIIEVQKPSIFFRERKNDNIFKNKMYKHGLRFIQFRADWYDNMTMAGEIRNEKMFQFGLDHALVFTHCDENNTEGLQSIQYHAYTNNIPLTVYINKELVFTGTSNYPIMSKPVNIEEKSDEVKRFIEINSDEYKKKMENITKKCKKIYYDGLKDRPTIKKIDTEDVDGINKGVNKKVRLSKTKTKKILKKEKIIQKAKPITLKEELFD